MEHQEDSEKNELEKKKRVKSKCKGPKNNKETWAEKQKSHVREMELLIMSLTKSSRLFFFWKMKIDLVLSQKRHVRGQYLIEVN